MNGPLVIHVEMLLFLKEKYVIPKSAQFILSGRSGANAPCLVVGENNLKKGLVFCHQYQVIVRMYRKEICSSTVWTVNDVLVNIYPFIILVDILGCANKKTKYHSLTFLMILVDPDYAQDML